MLPKRFTVRVYGILVNERGEVLLSQEQIEKFPFTKFPGGGLEFGEGPEDCVVREFEEETGLKVFCNRHIYTSGFYIKSAIDPEEQVIGIYYEVKPLDDEYSLDKLEFREKTQDFRGKRNIINLTWANLHVNVQTILTFEMDKVALSEYKNSLLKT
ncbi:MAG: NUDIX hydrolase [Bacteroidia bacterium]